MRRLLAIPALISVLVACGTAVARPPERELWSGSVSGIDVAIVATVEDGALVPAIRTWNARLPAPRYVIGAPLAPIAGGDPAALPRVTATVCPVEAGAAYRIEGSPWRVLWVLGGRVLDAAPELSGERCEELEVPDRYEWLSLHPGGATTCLALDEDGDRYAALDCMALGQSGDLVPEGIPPGHGAPDLAAMIRRIANDPTALDTYEDRVLAQPIDRLDDADVALLLAPIDAADGRSALLWRISGRCGDPERPCDEATIALVERLLDPAAPEPCAGAAAIARALVARPEPDRVSLRPLALRAAWACDTPDLRALALDLLAGADGDPCPTEGPIPRSCEAPAAIAASWLARHCGEDVLARARELAPAPAAARALAACDRPRPAPAPDPGGGPPT